MNSTRIVNTLKDVSRVANELFSCRVSVDPKTRGVGEDAKGRRIVKLIVGKTPNPAYDPNIDPATARPDQLGLVKLTVADVRLIKIMPGGDY